jgi:hypothetical protein
MLAGDTNQHEAGKTGSFSRVESSVDCAIRHDYALTANLELPAFKKPPTRLFARKYRLSLLEDRSHTFGVIFGVVHQRLRGC